MRVDCYWRAWGRLCLHVQYTALSADMASDGYPNIVSESPYASRRMGLVFVLIFQISVQTLTTQM